MDSVTPDRQGSPGNGSQGNPGNPGNVDLVGLTRALVDIDSTTGREADAGRWLAQYLRGLGFSVAEQRVDDARFNLFAS